MQYIAIILFLNPIILFFTSSITDITSFLLLSKISWMNRNSHFRCQCIQNWNICLIVLRIHCLSQITFKRWTLWYWILIMNWNYHLISKRFSNRSFFAFLRLSNRNCHVICKSLFQFRTFHYFLILILY